MTTPINGDAVFQAATALTDLLIKISQAYTSHSGYSEQIAKLTELDAEAQKKLQDALPVLKARAQALVDALNAT